LTRVQTASQGVSLAAEIEQRLADFYDTLASLYGNSVADLPMLAEDSRKSAKVVRRTYYSAITDALESAYCFDIDPAVYLPQADISPETPLREALARAAANESMAMEFYSTAGEQCRALIADLAHAFLHLSGKHGGRRLKVRALASSAPDPSPKASPT
jgi:hypothetical protein